MSAEPGEWFATLTHARLRAAQGDIVGAVRILRVLLEVQPGHPDARDLLSELESRVPVAHREPADVLADVVTPATVGDLSRRFREALGTPRRSARAERLSRWLERVQRCRGERRVR